MIKKVTLQKPEKAIENAKVMLNGYNSEGGTGCPCNPSGGAGCP